MKKQILLSYILNIQFQVNKIIGVNIFELAGAVEDVRDAQLL